MARLLHVENAAPWSYMTNIIKNCAVKCRESEGEGPHGPRRVLSRIAYFCVFGWGRQESWQRGVVKSGPLLTALLTTPLNDPSVVMSGLRTSAAPQARECWLRRLDASVFRRAGQLAGESGPMRGSPTSCRGDRLFSSGTAPRRPPRRAFEYTSPSPKDGGIGHGVRLCDRRPFISGRTKSVSFRKGVAMVVSRSHT